jgi:hypothetical protein
MGEIRGFLVENAKADHVEIRHSWEEGSGLKPPKYKFIHKALATIGIFEV